MGIFPGARLGMKLNVTKICDTTDGSTVHREASCRWSVGVEAGHVAVHDVQGIMDQLGHARFCKLLRRSHVASCCKNKEPKRLKYYLFWISEILQMRFGLWSHF
uniref:Uncharacterized protein n=1 Tax=Steinernema glaseri TaxID=37863 RepID=A0A1I7Y6S2_9BILA